METFLQTVGHLQLGTLAGFTACFTTFQALSDRGYYLYRKAVARKAEYQPFAHQWMQYKCRSRGCPVKFSMKVVNGKLLLQEFERLHTHPRRNTAVCLLITSNPVVAWDPELGGLSGSFVKHAPQICSVGGAALDRFKKRLAVSADGHGCARW